MTAIDAAAPQDSRTGRKWFLDTEFDENGRTIELISIALVSVDGSEYYAVSNEFQPDLCNDWVKQNVLTKLPPACTWKPRAQIRDEIASSIPPASKPEFWAYFADYDWVAFCQLFGRMIDLPKGYPMFCMDLKQAMRMNGIERDRLPPQIAGQHDALCDARWVRAAHQLICV
jgi:hypothetical protein